MPIWEQKQFVLYADASLAKSNFANVYGSAKLWTAMFRPQPRF